LSEKYPAPISRPDFPVVEFANAIRYKEEPANIIATYPWQPSAKVEKCTNYGTVIRVRTDITLDVVFFRTESGNEPVREWLRGLSKAEKRVIGSDIKTVQYGWPIGMPVVRKLEAGLWEVRSRLDQRISRILFTVHGDTMVLLHGFIKKSQKTLKGDLQLAKDRKANLEK
jgi:phage-related protein